MSPLKITRHVCLVDMKTHSSIRYFTFAHPKLMSNVSFDLQSLTPQWFSKGCPRGKNIFRRPGEGKASLAGDFSYVCLQGHFQNWFFSSNAWKHSCRFTNRISKHVCCQTIDFSSYHPQEKNPSNTERGPPITFTLNVWATIQHSKVRCAVAQTFGMKLIGRFQHYSLRNFVFSMWRSLYALVYMIEYKKGIWTQDYGRNCFAGDRATRREAGYGHAIDACLNSVA